jgi:preprotein translocase subunit YajC
MGSNVLAAAKSSGGFSATELILILVVVVGFYMLMIRPQRKRQQQAQQRQNSVRPGARVRTTAGMYATVVAVDEESGDVVLEVAPNVEVRYMKRAIMDVVSPSEEPEETEEPEADETAGSYEETEYDEAEHDEPAYEETAADSVNGFHGEAEAGVGHEEPAAEAKTEESAGTTTKD